MSEMVLNEAYDCLDLTPDASLLQVERTYRRKRTLFAENSLATYALMDEGGRRQYLDRLEAAYQRICGAAAPPQATSAPAVAARPDPDAAAAPGHFLRARREAAGLSLQEVAERTKIGSRKLAQIEEEKYEALPAPVYLRGFVLAYARLLGLPDPDGTARLFLAGQRQMLGDA